MINPPNWFLWVNWRDRDPPNLWGHPPVYMLYATLTQNRWKGSLIGQKVDLGVNCIIGRYMILFSILLAFFLLVGVLIASTKMDKRFQKKRTRIKNNNKFRINYFRKWFWPPKHHNITTTIIRLSVCCLGLIFIALL